MEIDLIAESVKFLFLGMGIVIAFLIIIIFILKAQNKMLANFLPKEETANATPINVNVSINGNVNEKIDPAKMAAIIAAVQHHKNLKG